MIPKVIHYCWFGRTPLPESAQRCIASWRKYLPDYEIIEWNEDNFDVNSIPYTRQAYEAKKYAFVSDYARFKILYDHGGVYFDTDVEVVKPFDDILQHGAFMGIEYIEAGKEIGKSSGLGLGVNPGLGLGVNSGLGLCRELLEAYAGRNFLLSDNSYNQTTIVTYTTQLLLSKGLKAIDEIQDVEGLTIYPREYFNPLDNNTGRLHITPYTHSIHWYDASWQNSPGWRRNLSRLAHRCIGFYLSSKIRKLLSIK